MKTLFLFSLLFALSIPPLLADIVKTSTSKHYGKIISINGTSITFMERCQQPAITFVWNVRTSVFFNEDCNPPAGELSSSPIIRESQCIKMAVFLLKIKNWKNAFYCNSIAFDGTNFNIVFPDGRKFLIPGFSNNNSNVDFLMYSNECRDSVRSPLEIPTLLKQTDKPAATQKTQLTQPSCKVRLERPMNNQSFTQQPAPGNKVKTVWRFNWSSCEGATKYHLYVIGANAQNPVINNDDLTRLTHLYSWTGYPSGSVQKWIWKVRAFINGQWEAWSDPQTFNELPGSQLLRISGYIRGPLALNSYSDVGGESFIIRVTNVILVTPDGHTERRVPLQGRNYRFNNVLPNKSYKIYPDIRFISNPAFINIPVASPGARYERKNFRITGVKSD